MKLHMQHLQHHILFHPQGFRRRRDGSSVKKQTLFDGVHDGVEGLFEVNFRPKEWGQLEWSFEGEEYYIQWMPPTMHRMEAPPEMLIAHMDYVGVDMAVLQSDHVYGDLNEYLSEVVRRYPNRLIGLAQVNEWEAYKKREQERLRYAIEELGLKGLYFYVEGYYVTNFRENFMDEKYADFWGMVRFLQIPVFWSLYTSRINQIEDFREQCKRLSRFAEEYPDIRSVITHGIETFSMLKGAKRFKIFPEVWDCLQKPNVQLEVLFHIMVADMEYPYSEVRQPLKEIYQELGPEKLLWGDLPRTWTRETIMGL